MRQDGSGKYNEVQVHVTLGKANNTDYGTGSGSSGNQKGGYNSQEENTQESPEGSGGDSVPSEEQEGSSQEEDELYKQFKDFFNEYKR